MLQNLHPFPVHCRNLSTQALTDKEALELLNHQRRLRPSSPHFTIYEPQLSWLTSIANRVTGTGLSVGIYALAISYVAAPLAGLHFDSSSIISLISSLPLWAKLSAKTIVGAPFWFHTWNGMRHLSWDMGWLLDLKKSWTAGYIVLGLTGVSTIATTFFL
ncbi:cytochrome b560 subunit of succinate dehydrogenase [Cystobasidium minutum MCA 4210]|uniref:cytochrome b560 subunit of succinate dehydrogenase n=1 Tax=Cystobasidium minutum MCA 4210 TaxID=1397322 RepID=UPI0034CF3886|eukprot:jgi/Rhomi1/142468/e_gw1.3.1234.1